MANWALAAALLAPSLRDGLVRGETASSTQHRVVSQKQQRVPRGSAEMCTTVKLLQSEVFSFPIILFSLCGTHASRKTMVHFTASQDKDHVQTCCRGGSVLADPASKPWPPAIPVRTQTTGAMCCGQC